jgi:hypothetical protein
VSPGVGTPPPIDYGFYPFVFAAMLAAFAALVMVAMSLRVRGCAWIQARTSDRSDYFERPSTRCRLSTLARSCAASQRPQHPRIGSVTRG